MGDERRPYDVLWSLRSAHDDARRARKQVDRANADLREAMRRIDSLEDELLPLLPEDGDIRRFRVDDSTYIEAARSGQVVSTELIKPEYATMLDWPKPPACCGASCCVDVDDLTVDLARSACDLAALDEESA